MRKILLLLFTVGCWQLACAQELKCTVTVNSDKIEGSNKQVFETLKSSIEEYMNNNRWTNMSYAEFEKIECSMMILVNKVEGNLYSCEMTLQSRRPVYGTTYTTPLLNFKDKAFNFTYQEYDRIEYQHADCDADPAQGIAHPRDLRKVRKQRGEQGYDQERGQHYSRGGGEGAPKAPLLFAYESGGVDGDNAGRALAYRKIIEQLVMRDPARLFDAFALQHGEHRIAAAERKSPHAHERRKKLPNRSDGPGFKPFFAHASLSFSTIR